MVLVKVNYGEYCKVPVLEIFARGIGVERVKKEGQVKVLEKVCREG